MRIFQSKSLFLKLLSIIIFPLFCGHLWAAELLISKSEKAVVELISEKGTIGTGFFINSSGLILTNQHVVGDYDNTVQVKTFKKEKTYQGKVIHSDEELDLALVEVDTTNSHPYLHIDTFDEIGRGHEIFIIGHPHIEIQGKERKQPWAVELGEITSLIDKSNDLRYLFKHNITVFGGNSGGPVISRETGFVIGIVTSKYIVTNYNFAINSNTILKWIRSVSVELPPKPRSNSVTPPIPPYPTSETFIAGIATGRSDGTYKEMGDNISSLVSENGIKLTVISDEKGDGVTRINDELQPTTIGSIKNIELIHTNPWVKTGMVQTDVLQYLRRDETRMNLVDDIRFLLPLHTEKIHVIARKEITSINDLKKGLRLIAVDEKDSGTFLTATTLLNAMGISEDTYVEMGGKTALEYLEGGKIDALFYVTGVPAESLQRNISSDLHMLDVKSSELGSLPVGTNEIYQPAKILRDDYPWLDKDVSTISVRAVLMTFNYENTDCRAVRKMTSIIKNNYKTLLDKNPRHWESVNLNLNAPNGWEVFRPEQCN